MRISPIAGYAVDDLRKASESHIERCTGFRVCIREKQHSTVLECVEKFSEERQEKMTTGQRELDKRGNCIPAAIAALLSKQDMVEEALEANSENPKLRSYAECELLCQVKLIPHLSFQELKQGNFLLHSEAGGKPHCVGLHLYDGDLCIVYDASCVFKLSRASLEDAINSGTDSSTCVFFRLLEGDVDAADFLNEELDEEDVSRLLTLEAGGQKRPASACKKTRSGNEKGRVVKKPAARKSRSAAASRGVSASVVPSGLPLHDFQADAAISIHGSDSETEFLQAVSSSDAEMDPDTSPAAWLQEDAIVVVDSQLLKSLADEAESLAAAAVYQKVSTGFACPCCPWRCFQSPGRVTEHLRRYHNQRNQYCCSGTKQIKCILSLHDSDMIRGHHPSGKYLQRSAQLLKQQVKPPLPRSVNAIDKRIRLMFDSEGVAMVKRQVFPNSVLLLLLWWLLKLSRTGSRA